MYGFYLLVLIGYLGSLYDVWVLRLSEIFDVVENENIVMEFIMDFNGIVIWLLIVGDLVYFLKIWLFCFVKDNGILIWE